MWLEFFLSVSNKCTFTGPASTDDIIAVEKQFGVKLPEEYKGIILETNGVKESYELGLIWSLERVIEENLRYREQFFKTYYMPFDSLLFFAESGIGDLFAFPIINQIVCKEDVFVWNHDDDSRRWVAPSVSKYVEWWLNGCIKI
ncbi:SMI1/KNR4 family protein [Paenibacillus eucommiae]|uniref:Cell wall assembly regulator SMI1 n=1 Tax=Paenibacillus eucommiae TaxID=1355755 RepID=A0ABS4J5A3_9BACL|nr:SMI1/KNR4 family protein [Paenibacillus eucommiae]MBP1994441.1 cell wall assembly regulator SMI1 [Paenibacillus eucommiae]